MVLLFSSFTFIMWFTIIAIVAMIIALENESGSWASTFFSLVTALLLWNYGNEVLAYVTENILQVIGFAVGYVLVGIGWSFLKWTSKVKAIFKRFGKVKEEFETKHGSLTDEKNLAKFNSKISYEFTRSNNNGKYTVGSKDSINETIKGITPKGESYKATIVSWISYWPLSLLGTLVNDPFRRFFNWVYESISGFYDKITQNQIDNYVK
jgi:hypothetical protein